MPLTLSPSETIAFQRIANYLDQALADGVEDDLGNRLVEPMLNYNHPNTAPYKGQIKAAFLAVAAAVVKELT